MDTSLVSESTEASDVVVEGNRDLNGVGDQVLDVSQCGQVVLFLDTLGAVHV